MARSKKFSTSAPGVAQDREASPQGNSLQSEPPGKPAKGAPPSNTAPSNCISGSNTRILRTGVDSLYVSYKGRVSADLEAQFEDLKLKAQHESSLVVAQAIIELAYHRFEVRDRGKGRYPYVLVDNFFHIQVAKRKSDSIPGCYCQIGSELLTFGGQKTAVSLLTAFCSDLGDIDPEPQVSRIDLCTDFVIDIDLEHIPRGDCGKPKISGPVKLLGFSVAD